jgi:hypothetical protein
MLMTKTERHTGKQDGRCRRRRDAMRKNRAATGEIAMTAGTWRCCCRVEEKIGQTNGRRGSENGTKRQLGGKRDNGVTETDR